MKFLYFLEGLRNPVFDFFFSVVTHIGEELFFLAAAIIFFWCVNKREGYYILTVGLMGTLISQWLKLLCRVPRPWVKDPSFTIVESARAEATGYSFPSGHTQNASGTFGAIATYTKRPWLRWISIAIVILVPLSRMYLGVHTPADVLVALGIAAVLVLGLYPLFVNEKRFHAAMPYIMGVGIALSVLFSVYAFAVAEGGEAHNLESARKNAATLLGCVGGLCVVYPLDRFKIKFETEARWYSQLIKLILGIGIVLLIKEGMRAPLEFLLGTVFPEPLYVARGVRYFLIVIFAGAIWPLSFNFFKNLRIPCMEKFGAWVINIFSKKSHATGDK